MLFAGDVGMNFMGLGDPVGFESLKEGRASQRKLAGLSFDDGFKARHFLAGLGSEFRRGVVASLPPIVGIIPFALVLGAQAAQKGLNAIEVPLMTGLNFAGGVGVCCDPTMDLATTHPADRYRHLSRQQPPSPDGCRTRGILGAPNTQGSTPRAFYHV